MSGLSPLPFLFCFCSLANLALPFLHLTLTLLNGWALFGHIGFPLCVRVSDLPERAVLVLRGGVAGAFGAAAAVPDRHRFECFADERVRHVGPIVEVL